MLIKQIILALIGLSSGAVVAGGVFALIITIGVIPRMAAKTNTASRILLYEDCVLAGGVFGNLISMYPVSVPVGAVGLAVYGLFAGISVGCLAVALAEVLNAIPIFFRRIRLVHHHGWIVLSLALGKMTGAFYYFYMRLIP